MPRRILGSFAGLLCAGTRLVEGKDYCFGVNNEQYRCEMGYCCGETECCTYYYELWFCVVSVCVQGSEFGMWTLHNHVVSCWFWTDCKLPDYEEVVGHPPTPPPPYSEVPSEAQPPINRPEAAVVLELPAEASDRPSCDWTDQEDPNTRRRHVTGDSGIEVCVCQLDVDEGLGPEEGRLCQGAAGGCCSERQIDANKALMSEPNGDAERLV
ncbi:putative WW domain-binding protein 1-like [Triplophysa rosa]|uniref:WW domain-binding protein 1-like n=1 Tax=Triplophysa rosa TaxID=992332 RepID=A0A9W7X1X5_TRIRA|nr:putative WW domain-binding protein 1-like [Triplophysa rosa]